MKIIIKNKKAFHDYEVLQTFEAGVVLSGPEVKSVKYGNINLSAGYINIDNKHTPWLINVNISPYAPAFSVQTNYDPKRTRKLLLHKKEIIPLIGKLKTQGLTLIPLQAYTKKGIIKIKIGLCKGKKKWDKRENIKKRDIKRKIKQALKKANT